jgi:mannose-6-phosphate isomerase-like protein (cupin superfamily)
MKYGPGFSMVLAATGTWVLASCTPAAEQTAAPEPAPAQADAPLTHLAQDPALQWGACPDIFPAGCEIAVLHGDPAQPNADLFLRVPGGYSLPAHSHTSAERMVLVSGELNVHYQGADATSLSVGEYAFGPAGLPHVGACVSAEPCTLFIAFEGPVDALPFEGTVE